MPWLGLRDGEKVVPAGIADGESVFCPDCGGEMFPRGPFDDGRARHFVHKSTSLGGGGGNCSYSVSESEIHRKWKSLALSGLRQRFDDLDSAELEVDLDVSETLSLAETRRADVLVTFDEESVVFGEGVVVEVQHANEGKNVDVVTNDYLSLGYSVFWATADHFASDRFRLETFDSSFKPDSEIAYCPYHDAFDEAAYLDLLSEEFFDGWWCSTNDPIPQCDHEFDTKICAFCLLQSKKHPTSGVQLYSAPFADEFRVETDSEGHIKPYFIDCTHDWRVEKSGNGNYYVCKQCEIETNMQGVKCYVSHSSDAMRLRHRPLCGYSWYIMPGKIVCDVCEKEYEAEDATYPY